jgi:hypothetical protein
LCSLFSDGFAPGLASIDNVLSGRYMARTQKLAIILCLTLAAMPACLVRRHAVTPRASRQNIPLVSATKEQLIQRVHALSDPIQSFIMRADLSPSVTNPSKKVVTDYATVGAAILFRRPYEIRILGKDPVLGATIFDMVSSGNEFRVYIPSKGRFLIGSNSAPGTSPNKLENLRPSTLLTSLMIYPPDPEADLTLLESDMERGLYILLIVRHRENEFNLTREIYFDGHSLQISRQKTFDPAGGIVSDTKYSDLRSFGGFSFFSEIDIQQPRDDYEVRLSVVSMKINTAEVTPDKFVLAPPADVKVEQLK